MIKAEFGIVEDIEEAKQYSYAPEKYQCVCIDDDVYIDDWWVTLIPPESLPAFQEIVLSDKRINEDANLRELSEKIRDAASRNKYMIHFGV